VKCHCLLLANSACQSYSLEGTSVDAFYGFFSQQILGVDQICIQTQLGSYQKKMHIGMRMKRYKTEEISPGKQERKRMNE